MTAGKRQPPLRLDMNFAEALERFVRTEPDEMAPEAEAAGIQPAAKEVRKARKRLVQPAREKRADPD